MVIVITGLITAGKTTLAKLLKEQGYEPVLEYTTRPMREGEADGVTYYFVGDKGFDRMKENDEFAELNEYQTQFGLWKYGVRKDDLKDGGLLICGPSQMAQLLDSGIPMLSVLLDISREAAEARAKRRGDNMQEFDRRWTSDEPAVGAVRDRVDLVLDAADAAEVNARAIDSRCRQERREVPHEV